MVEQTQLFTGTPLVPWLENRLAAATNLIITLPSTTFATDSLSDLQKKFEAAYWVDVPVLRPEELEIDNEAGRVTITLAGHRRPEYVELCVPFSGDVAVFGLKPPAIGGEPPRAILRAEHGELRLPVQYALGGVPDLDVRAQEWLASIEVFLEEIRGFVDDWNQSLSGTIREKLTALRERAQRDESQLMAFSIPLRRRKDAPEISTVPLVRRFQEGPANADAPAHAEYSLDDDGFRHALVLLRRATKTMERSPETFGALNEENIRDICLVMLNSHFEGQATGETFNAGGKTDIIIRVEDRNVFIGELKVWKGPKSFTDALDQLLGYTTWRDSKLCLVMLVDRKDPGGVVGQGRMALERHAAFGRSLDADEKELSARIVWPDDRKRSAELAVLFVHLPTRVGPPARDVGPTPAPRPRASHLRGRQVSTCVRMRQTGCLSPFSIIGDVIADPRVEVRLKELGLPVAEGCVELFHATTAEAAEQIRSSGAVRPDAQGVVFVSTSSDIAGLMDAVHGKSGALLRMRIPVVDLDILRDCGYRLDLHVLADTGVEYPVEIVSIEPYG